jgi:hypothetical protein
MTTSLERNHWFILIGYLVAIGMSVVLYISFLVAYLNGMKVTVSIDGSGEALLEFFLLPVLIGFMFVGILLLFRSWHIKVDRSEQSL